MLFHPVAALSPRFLKYAQIGHLRSTVKTSSDAWPTGTFYSAGKETLRLRHMFRKVHMASEPARSQ
jgi:hypothetical protein